MITGKARLAGVIGWPVCHSRSPALHNFWLRRYGIDGAYVPLAVRAEDFALAVQGLRAAGFAGANVTIPHKEAAFALCDTVDASARQAGAVNTLVFGESGISGANTDGYGFLANLRAHGVRLGARADSADGAGEARAGSALVLGAGGAARAIAAALLGEGLQVCLTNRTRAKVDALAACFPDLTVIDWTERERALEGCTLLVNTTSLGMHGKAPLQMSLAAAPAGLAVADIVYAPLETALLQDARARGCDVVPGIGMLLHQAVPGFAAWFGVTPVVDAETMDAVLAAS